MIKNFKMYDGLQSKKKFNLKRVASTALVLSMLAVAPTTAHAYVDANTITGDIAVTEDRTQTRVAEAEAIDALFTSGAVDVATVERAIELSDALNGYYPGPNEYSNTSYNEVMNFDLNAKYAEYQSAVAAGRVNEFCANNMNNEAVIDAYTLFGCETVKNNILSEIASIAQGSLSVQNRTLSELPKIVINGNVISVILNYEGQYVKLDVMGGSVEEVIAACQDLMNHYNIGLDNAAGRNNEYENSFAYQGAYTAGTDSAYLSIGDDYRKDDLRRGISIYNTLKARDLDVTASFAQADHLVDEGTKAYLRTFGYTEDQLNQFVQVNVYVDAKLENTRTK